MNKEAAQEQLEKLTEEAEKSIHELLKIEKEIKAFGINLLNESVRKEFEDTLDRAKETRLYYVKQLGKLDRTKRKLEEL